MVVTLGQPYNVGKKPTVILYTYINRHAGTHKTKKLQRKHRKCDHLGLFEAKHTTCVVHGLARYSFLCFRSQRVDRCVGVEHEEYLEAVDLTSYAGTIPT